MARSQTPDLVLLLLFLLPSRFFRYRRQRLINGNQNRQIASIMQNHADLRCTARNSLLPRRIRCSSGRLDGHAY